MTEIQNSKPVIGLLFVICFLVLGIVFEIGFGTLGDHFKFRGYFWGSTLTFSCQLGLNPAADGLGRISSFFGKGLHLFII